MEEIWKPMFYKDMDLSDRFLVSNKGNIYSLISNKILKQTPNKSTGYYGLCVSLFTSHYVTINSGTLLLSIVGGKIWQT